MEFIIIYDISYCWHIKTNNLALSLINGAVSLPEYELLLCYHDYYYVLTCKQCCLQAFPDLYNQPVTITSEWI